MAGRARLTSVDALRGVAMVLMALDHTRDFFGVVAVSPTDLTRASAPLFLTRWVTHFCAPTFFLLTGTGAALMLGRRSRAEVSRLLVTRGLWLAAFEAIVVRCLVYQFNADFQITLLLVLWTLGWSMVVLGALVWLPLPAVGAFAALLIAGHNLLDGLRIAHPLWTLLHVPGFVVPPPAPMVFSAYPLIPWVGVTAAGYLLGHVYTWPAERRRALLMRLGVTGVAAFAVLRGVNVYGDPQPWQSMATPLATALSFLDTQKYPPSLLFLLMTLGPALVVLSRLDRGVPRWLQPAAVFGRVPLFYYVGHFFLLHALAAAACLALYGTAHWMFESPDLASYPFTQPPGWGLGLPAVYVLWVGVVALMYVPSRWFAEVKRRRTDWWLSYL